MPRRASAMRFVSVLAEDSASDDAIARATEDAARALGGIEPQLVLLFASRHHADAYERIGERVRDAFPRALVLGCSAQSVIGAGHEREEGPGLALAAAVLPDVELLPFHLPPHTLPSEDATADDWHALIGVTPEDRPSFLLLADPFSADVESFVAGLDASYPGCVKLGGLASGAEGPGESALFLGEDVLRGGLVGVALLGNIEIDTIVAQGCRPVGTPLFVTRCRENVLLEADGRPPLEVLQELYSRAESRDQTLFRSSLFAGIEMGAPTSGEYRQGDFLIRNLIGSDEKSGALAVAARLHTGQVFQFHLRDAETSRDDLDRCLARWRERSQGAAEPAGALLFSCLGRGAQLYGKVDHDTDAFRRHVGPVPLTGFFCNGEIGPVEGATFLHGYTSAFGIIRPRARA
jgi:small ligand-binding sensory domain FIST